MADPFAPHVGTDFEKFDATHPHIGRALLAMARQYADARPGQPCGLRMLFETARWHIITREPDQAEAAYMMPNEYAPYYARKLAGEHPELAGMFELRWSAADSWAYGKGYPVSKSYADAMASVADLFREGGPAAVVDHLEREASSARGAQ